MLPLRFGTSDEFALIHGFLRDSGYTEKNICARLGVHAMHELVGRLPAEWVNRNADDVLGLLIRLFLFSECLPSIRVEASFPAAVVQAFRKLGLLCEEQTKPGALSGPMALYPAQGLYFVSDRWIYPDQSVAGQLDDIVYPAISRNTFDFLEMLPGHACENFLDLCSGTGVAALVAASRYARHAWAVDITGRATRCAEFNRLLNGIENATIIQGNLYEPLGDLTFDRIVAHPPYVPAIKPGKVYCDGGEDGERVTRAAVEGLAGRLNPHGSFYCLTLGIEREGEPFELRARQWLREKNEDFDILYVLYQTESLRDFAYQATVRARGDRAQIEQWKAHFAGLKIKELVHGALVIQRKESSRSPFTLRRQRGGQSGTQEAEWLMRWETESALPANLQWAAELRPRASRELGLHVLHRVQEGEMTPVEFKLETDYPFSMECKIQPWMAMMVARCDGKMSIREIFESCKQDHLVRPETPIEDFVKLLHTFISGGFLEVDSFPLPNKNGAED